jgi:chemotaxis family two-component system response regulator Rcp1
MTSVVILLVEDNPGDIELTKIAMKRSKLHCDLHIVQDGIEALDFLFQRGSFATAPRPDLVLLDLNLPRKGGREILEEIKSSPELHQIPVCVLTASKTDEDILRSYDLHANCYITKPIGFEEFMQVVQSFGDFWFTIVKLPGACKTQVPSCVS